MSTTLSYPVAKALLTEVEKDRIVCSYLNSHDMNAVDWEKAAADYGAASAESYKKGMQNTAKKIKKAIDNGFQPEAAGAAEGTPAKKGGRKRKEKSVVAESEGEEEAVEEAPKPKKKKGKKSKAAKKYEAVASEGEEDGVKAEVDDE